MERNDRKNPLKGYEVLWWREAIIGGNRDTRETIRDSVAAELIVLDMRQRARTLSKLLSYRIALDEIHMTTEQLQAFEDLPQGSLICSLSQYRYSERKKETTFI